ncbi:MAG TPA: shikimate kinase [Syntrophorhabdales bacterium]|nr:shikimate kinase [Syntrophorhabdales bacterium]
MGNIYAVAGNPILASRSPRMFNAAFRELSLDAVYTRLAVTTAEEVITTAREAGIDGLNITSPFKADVIPFLDEVEEVAAKIRSVNTVVQQAGKFFGYTTDPAGVLGALKETSFEPAGKKTVVLGAGGAGRAAALALLSAGAEVVLVNRSLEKAEEAAGVLRCSVLPFERAEEALKGSHLLISTISSEQRVIEPGLLSRELTVLDANYSRPTALLQDAQRAGCNVVDGRLWLLHQALPAFGYFTGETAPLETMRKALMKKTWPVHRNIALIGLSGSGKSTVATELAALTGMSVIDIDSMVEEKAARSIAELFEKEGEETFRNMERTEVQKLWNISHAVVACGGGAILTKRNIQTIRSTSVPVWLWASPKTLLTRIADTGSRPLLHGEDPLARIEKQLGERRFFYASTADLLISTEGERPDEIAGRIWSEIHKTLSS